MKPVPASILIQADQLEPGMLFTDRWHTDHPGFWWFGCPTSITGIYREDGKWRAGSGNSLEDFQANPPRTFIVGAHNLLLPPILQKAKPRTPVGPWTPLTTAGEKAWSEYHRKMEIHYKECEAIRKQEAAWELAWENFYPAFWRTVAMVWVKLEGSYDIWSPGKKARRVSRKKRVYIPTVADLEQDERNQAREDRFA